MQSQEIHHRTLFSAIQDEETLRRVVDVSKKYVGDWSKPDVGVLFVLPILEAYGLDKHNCDVNKGLKPLVHITIVPQKLHRRGVSCGCSAELQSLIVCL
jgi:hypothetical protein